MTDPPGEFVEHFQGHHPLRPVPLGAGNLRRRPPPTDLLDLLGGRHPRPLVWFLRPGRIEGDRLLTQPAGVGVGGFAIRTRDAALVPGLRHEQPPVQHRRRRVGRRVDADGDLAVGDLTEGAGVLPGHTRRSPAVLGKPGVVDHPHLRHHRIDRSRGQPPPHTGDIPRRRGQELLQLLVIDPEPIGHRLHRLTPALQHQPPKIPQTSRPLIRPRQPREDPGREVLQPRPHPNKIPLIHAPQPNTTTKPVQATRHNDLTKHY